jgi:hypothetical protein
VDSTSEEDLEPHLNESCHLELDLSEAFKIRYCGSTALLDNPSLLKVTDR